MNISLLKYNRHWEKNYRYPYPLKREVFARLSEQLDNKFILQLTGLRRTGKSTLIFQLINSLLEKGVNPFCLLYFTFDELPEAKIETLLDLYHIQSGIDYRKEKIYVFLDEIQKLADFQNQLKVYYDLYPNIKFIISGSASLHILKKSQESLAGRTFDCNLFPLSFREYLMFKKIEDLLDKPGLYQKDILRELEIYFQSQFIECIGMKETSERKEYLVRIIKKIVFEDLPSIFKFDNPQILYRLATYIGQKPGCIINNVHLASEFQINNKTVSLYLSYLEQSMLVNKYYNFTKNLISSEKRLKKYYLASPSLSFALVDFVNSPQLFENIFASLNKPMYFFRDHYDREIDFIIIKDYDKIIPVEVKYKDEISNNDLNNLEYFLNKYKLSRGYVVYKGMEKKKINLENKSVILVPFHEEILE